MKRVSLEQAAKDVLGLAGDESPGAAAMCARAVLEAARWRRNTREELVHEMWSALKRAASKL